MLADHLVIEIVFERPVHKTIRSSSRGCRSINSLHQVLGLIFEIEVYQGYPSDDSESENVCQSEYCLATTELRVLRCQRAEETVLLRSEA